MKRLGSITWLPESICDEVVSEVDRELTCWADAWGIAKPGMVRAERVPALESVAPEFVDLLAEWPVAWKRELAQSLFKLDVDGSTLIDAVLVAVIAALQTRLRAVFGSAPASDDVSVPVGHAGVLVIVEVLGHPSGLMLSCAQLKACGKLRRPTPVALGTVDMERALAGLPVRLTAELGRVEVSLEELMHLAIGDVLLLKEAIDSPLRVRSPGSPLMLPAHLGRSSASASRALRWLPASSQVSSP